MSFQNYTLDVVEKMFEHVFIYASNGIILTDEDGIILAVNPAFCRITGFCHEEAIGQSPRIIKSFYQDNDFFEQFWCEAKNKGFFQSNTWNRRKSGDIFPAQITIRKIEDQNAKKVFLVAVLSELTLIDEESQTLNLAYYDPLTKIPNRYLLREHLSKLIHGVERSIHAPPAEQSLFAEKQIAVLFFDLNRFKQINDTYGHMIGDKLLQEVVARIKALTRKMDVFGRVGGDEFILVAVIGKDKNQAGIICDRIRNALSNPFQINSHAILTSVSIGVSFYPDDGKTPDELIEHADLAMYTAKKRELAEGFLFYNKELKK